MQETLQNTIQILYNGHTWLLMVKIGLSWYKVCQGTAGIITRTAELICKHSHTARPKAKLVDKLPEPSNCKFVFNLGSNGWNLSAVIDGMFGTKTQLIMQNLDVRDKDHLKKTFNEQAISAIVQY